MKGHRLPWLVLSALAVAVLLGVRAGEAQPDRKKRLGQGRCVVCLDVSGSGGASILKRVASVRDRILALNRFRQWDLKVIAIHGEVGLGQHEMLRKKLPRYVNAKSPHAPETAERHAVVDAIAIEAEKLGRDSALASRSCILSAIRLGGDWLAQDKSLAERKLIVVSDLIEECDLTDVDFRTAVDRGVVRKLVEAARGVGQRDMLSGVDVDVIPVGLGEYYRKNCRWMESWVLHDAWRRALSQLGAEQERLTFD